MRLIGLTVLLAACGTGSGGLKDTALSTAGTMYGTGTGSGSGTGTGTGTGSSEGDPPGMATAFVPYTLVAGTQNFDIQMFDLVTSDLPETAAELELSTGLFITAGLDSVEPPLFRPDPAWIGTVTVPEADRLPIELDGTILDMWYAGPFDYHSTAGLPIRIANTYDADAASSTIELWVASYETSDWSRVGQATDDGGVFAFDGDLKLISTLVLIDTTGYTNPPTPSDETGTGSLAGTVVGPGGVPVVDARVQYCRGAECLTDRSESDGSYSISDLDLGPGSFEIIPPIE